LYQELFHYVKQNLRYKEIKTIPGQLAAIRKAVLAIRATKSMVVSAGDLNSHSLGSFFVNPIVDKDQLQAVHDTLTAEQKETFRAHKAAGRYKLSAAWLIERSGFSKGFKHKSAMLSKNHCLALCNPGKASSNDVKELSGMIQAAVKDKWGIELEPEPGFVAP
jgi:UDP-N-acetylmuramate dehydrogenase